MNRKEENSIPIDLIYEILSRLPAKSIATFRCVSKLWGSILHRPYFTKLFLTRSSNRPRLLLALENSKSQCTLFSLPQFRNSCQKSLVVDANFHVDFPRDQHMSTCLTNSQPFSCGYASGLILFTSMWTSEELVSVVCNPNTGQYAILPKLRRSMFSCSYLGFDPVDKKYMVLSIGYPDMDDDHRILTLGTERWRKIQCSISHSPRCQGICISGVFYYKADSKVGKTYDMIVCFDGRSEKFKFIHKECVCNCYATLINYKGKLGVISLKNVDAHTVELCLWVLEDFEKQEWLKYVYTLLGNQLVDPFNVSIVGLTSTGEIVLSMYLPSKPQFNIIYFNLERNTLQSVEIKGLGKHNIVGAFVDHVDDLNVNDLKILKPSQGLKIMRTRQKREQRHTSSDLCNSTPSVKKRRIE